MADVTKDTAPGTRVMHMAWMKRAVLIAADDTAALIVLLSKPTEVISAPLGVLTVTSDPNAPALYPPQQRPATPLPTLTGDAQYDTAGAQNTGTLQAVPTSLAINVSSLKVAMRLKNWIIVENVTHLIESFATYVYDNIRPMSDSHAAELTGRKPLNLDSQAETTNTKE